MERVVAGPRRCEVCDEQVRYPLLLWSMTYPTTHSLVVHIWMLVHGMDIPVDTDMNMRMDMERDADADVDMSMDMGIDSDIYMYIDKDMDIDTNKDIDKI